MTYVATPGAVRGDLGRGHAHAVMASASCRCAVSMPRSGVVASRTSAVSGPATRCPDLMAVGARSRSIASTSAYWRRALGMFAVIHALVPARRHPLPDLAADDLRPPILTLWSRQAACHRPQRQDRRAPTAFYGW
jgi:hypothetical protein